MPHKVVFITYPGFEILDLAGPSSAFNLVNEISEENYLLSVVSATGGNVADRSGLTIGTERMQSLNGTENLIVVGGPTAPDSDLNNITVGLLRESALIAKRVASVCTGAFLLASTGLLAGRRVTTHWRYAGLLQQQHPDVLVQSDRIFIKDGKFWTSAGMTAGIDLALMLIEDDCGPEVAKKVAREMVVYHRRLGGQSQFSNMLEMMPKTGKMQKVLCFIRENISSRLTIDVMADVACLSSRQFSRAFLNTTGMTPAKAVERLRLELAQARIEEDAESLDCIAREVGFENSEKMRRSFISVFGRTPQEIRRSVKRY